MYARASHTASADDGSSSHGAAPGKRALTDGQLPTEVATPMGALLGHDVSNVTVHQDGKADAMGTRAFARGDELHFASGAYQPESPSGLSLIGHELAHVAQQREGRVAPTGVAGGMAANNDPALEAEADAAGAKVVQGFDLGGFLDFGAAPARAVAAPVVQGEDLPAAPEPAAAASPVPPEISARVGAEFHHSEDTSATRSYRITPTGGFLLVASSDGRGVGTLEFRHDNKFKDAWQTLVDFVIAHAAAIPATVPAAPAAPATGGEETASEPGFFDDPLGAIGDAISGAVDGAIDLGRKVLGLPSVIINAAIDLAFGPVADETPVAPGTEPATPGEEAEVPAGSETPVSSDMPAMSQFRWYGTGGVELGVTEVLAAAQLINSELGLGGTVAHVTEPAADVKGNSGSSGFFWFTADGTSCKNGYNGGTQYITFTIGHYGSTANPLSMWLADNPPGQRPEQFTYEDQPHQASPALQSLNLRNIPGGKACFATSQAMMAQAGVHAVGNGNDAEIKDIVTSETCEDGLVTSVTIDAVQSEKARAYVDFETSSGRPVLAGITYTNSTHNTDKKTDHWVVINAKAGAGQYTFFDPGNNLPADVASSSNVFQWDGEKLHKPGSQLYVVSWIRPNQESLEAWAAHWAQLQSGQESKG